MGPIHNLSTMAANRGLKNMCNMQHCCNCHHANANPLAPLVGHFNTNGSSINILWVEHESVLHIPSVAAIKMKHNMKCTTVDKVRSNSMGSDRDDMTNSLFERGKRTVRRYRTLHVGHWANGERNRLWASTDADPMVAPAANNNDDDDIAAAADVASGDVDDTDDEVDVAIVAARRVG